MAMRTKTTMTSTEPRMSVKAIPHDPMLPRDTDRCRCMSCGLYFNSTYAFGEHRVGGWEEDGTHRRCLTLEELRGRGWQQQPAGHWLPRKMTASGLHALRPAADPTEPVPEEGGG
jgi:hypothetical protein